MLEFCAADGPELTAFSPSWRYGYKQAGRTVLMWLAMQHDWPDAVSAFLKKCPMCDINAIDEESGMPALHFAIINNRPNTAKVLLDAGADYNIRDGNVKQNNDYESAKGELPEDARTAAQRADRSGDTETEQLVEYIEGASARPGAWPPRGGSPNASPQSA